MPELFVARRNRYSERTRRVARALAKGLVVPPLRGLEYLGVASRLFRAISGRAANQDGAAASWGDYRPGAGDVVVCANLKSGTNWTMQIAHQVAHRGKGEFAHIHDVVPWPDAIVRDYAIPLDDPKPRAESPTGLRVIKTHLSWPYIPHSDDATYICVVRDPKEVFVSSYHFIRDALLGPVMPLLGTWLEIFLSPGFAGGSWAEGAKSYWEERNRSNVLFLSYREMSEDPDGAVRRVAEQMGVILVATEFDAVCERSSFAYMKSIDDHFRAELAELGSDLPYDEVCAPAG